MKGKIISALSNEIYMLTAHAFYILKASAFTVLFEVIGNSMCFAILM